MIKFLIFLTSLFFLSSHAYGWYIENYQVEIKVENNGDLRVVERITVNFGQELKHGIYRDIPLEFINPAGVRHSLKISDIHVTDEKLSTLKTLLSHSPGHIRIRIGDPNSYVSGMQNYVIRYKIKYALYSLGNIDELYWNAIGTGWDVPIKRGIVSVTLPFDNPSIQYACYTGAFGSQGRDCRATKQGSEIVFTLMRQLAPREGMTVAVGWPQGLINFRTEPPWWQNPWLFAKIYIPSIILLFYLYWRKRGRDQGGRGVIQVQYFPPEGVTPIEAGTLIDEKVDSRDIVAEIIDLARRGYIKIIEIEEKAFLFGKQKDYIFQRQKDYDNELLSNSFDREIMNGIFEGGRTRKLSQLKKRFYQSIPLINKSVYSALTEKGYFFQNPLSIRNKFTATGFFTFVLSFIGGVALSVIFFMNPIPFMLSGMVTGIGLIVLGKFMPRKTRKGTELKEYLQGYEEFISRVERDVIEKLFPPDKIPEVFEKTLPYAIAFGEAEKWASAFEGLFIEPPRWYEGRGSFSPTSFAYSMNTFTSQASSILASTPRSSGSGSGGGGFSGGGGGGGGGGSW